MASDLYKDRLDRLVVRAGILSSREQAARHILAGRIRVDGVVVDKPGKAVSIRASLELQQRECQFVSRAGDKLAAALDEFAISCSDLTVMDVGASTGGFTDCLLRRGARRVYAIDVGYGQLDWRLRRDPRVVVMDRVNARQLQPADIPESPALAVIDVSFISLRLVLPVVLSILQNEAKVVALFKPQFEVGKGQVGRGGIVRDEWLRQQVLGEFLTFTEMTGLSLIGVLDSPVLGKKGNKEVLVALKKGGVSSVPGSLR
ncbi:MAG: TlyA family RNA methyltransferase [Nitrospirales bacterium]|nr:TlyA family RNA methyltransferase [Nitrospirales bacterium]